MTKKKKSIRNVNNLKMLKNVKNETSTELLTFGKNGSIVIINKSIGFGSEKNDNNS